MALAILLTSLLISIPIFFIIFPRYIERYNDALYGNLKVPARVMKSKKKGKGLNYFLEFWKNSFNFKGTTKRSEFWVTQLFLLFQFIYVVLLGINIYLITYTPRIVCWGNYFACDNRFFPFDESLILQFTNLLIIGFSFLTLIPSLSLQIRRLRDAAKNPWWILISFVPFLGGFVLLIFYLSPSRKKRLPMTLQDRLSEVEDLMKKGTIDEEEYKYIRKKILTKYVDKK